jgi:AcrR family transcriptional regulator
MATKQTPEQKFVTAACKAIEADGWTNLNLADVARKAKIPLSTVYDICPTKAALLPLIGKDVDLRFLENVSGIDETMHARDRAFDAILSWFEQLQPLKPVFTAIRNDSRGDLSLIVDLVPMAMRSAHWIAASARLPDIGWRGFAVTRGIGLLLADTLSVWLADSDDMAKTMAHIDRRLRTIEEWNESFHRIRRDATSGPGADED